MAVTIRLASRYCCQNLAVLRRSFSMSSKKLGGDEVLFEVHQNAGLITLNRPKALNALNLNMIRTMHPVLKEWEKDPNINVIVMKGSGEKAFCAGGDVRAIAEERNSGGELSKQFFKEEYRLNLEIGSLQTPFVALIHGITMGGGVGLSVHGKYRVATEKTLFAMPETAIGLFPDVGGGYFLPRLQGKLGLFLALTGHRLKARDVFHAGVATHFVESKELPYLEDEILKLAKPTSDHLDHLIQSYHKKCDKESEEFSLAGEIKAINRIFLCDTLEGIFQALEEEGSEFSLNKLETLKRMSPASMKVTLRQLQEGAKLTLAEDLIMEYRISQQCMAEDDFYEGIRAVLIERDNNPIWNPSCIEDVSDKMVDSYFQPLPEDRELTF